MKVQPKVFKHARCIVVQRTGGVDVVDPTTGVWRAFPTMRAAKWSATIFTRLSWEFGHRVAGDDLLKETLDQLKD